MPLRVGVGECVHLGVCGGGGKESTCIFSLTCQLCLYQIWRVCQVLVPSEPGYCSNVQLKMKLQGKLV